MQAESFIVVGGHPFGGVDHALFEGRIEVAARNLLCHQAEFRKYHAAQTADAHLQAFQVGNRFDLLAIPAPHLRAGIADRNAHDVVGAIEIVHGLDSAAKSQPGVLLACVQTKRQRGSKAEGGILADIKVAGSLAAFDGRVLHRIENLQGRHDLARSEYLDLKPVARKFGDAPGHKIDSADQGVEVFWVTRSEAPANFRCRLRP